MDRDIIIALVGVSVSIAGVLLFVFLRQRSRKDPLDDLDESAASRMSLLERLFRARLQKADSRPKTMLEQIEAETQAEVAKSERLQDVLEARRLLSEAKQKNIRLRREIAAISLGEDSSNGNGKEGNDAKPRSTIIRRAR